MKIKTIKISDEVMDVLKRSTITGNNLKLPEQLPRSLYDATMKIIGAAGGKWNRSAEAHVFPTDPREKLGLAIENGAVVNEKQTFQFFTTPPEIVRRMLLWAGIEPGHSILEPSAGDGAIYKGIVDGAGHSPDLHRIVCVELSPERVEKLKAIRGPGSLGHEVHCEDFLTLNGELGKFDRIIMNPPFTGGQDVKHIKHAASFLNPGGRLVAICSGGSKAEAELRPLSKRWEELPAGTFKESGTGVRTILLIIEA